MLVKISRDKSIFEDNPWLLNIPEFAILRGENGEKEVTGEKRMRYVAWYADYESPYRNHSDKERRRMAALEAGWHPQTTHDITMEPRAREVMNDQIPEVVAAIAKYKTLKPNEDRELLMLYQTQIENIREIISNPVTAKDAAEAKKANDLLMSLPELRKAQRELAKTVGMEDELGKIEEEVKSNRKMSTLDRIHAEEQSKKDL